MPPDRRAPVQPRRQGARAGWKSVALFGVAAVGAVQFTRLPTESPRPLSVMPIVRARALGAGPSPNAFGTSGEVKLRFTLPGGGVEFPLQVSSNPAQLRYQWMPVNDTTPIDSARALRGPELTAPTVPGFYRLVLVRGDSRELIPEPALAVMVPFSDKVGGLLNGYRIGTYLAERLGRSHDQPDGFLEVREDQLDLRVSKHFRLADFITHDSQGDVWPKYVALNPRLLDKVELVLEYLRERRAQNGSSPGTQLALDVHSGFRTPAYNARVDRSARDSRHQYGDAIDVVIDANGDGRITRADDALVARAVDAVEKAHPDLVGGLGLYTSGHYRTPYVHIDARGQRSRWRG